MVKQAQAADATNLVSLSQKQLALYWYIANLKINRQLIDIVKPVAEQGGGAPELAMWTHTLQWFCLFKLSDLGMW